MSEFINFYFPLNHQNIDLLGGVGANQFALICLTPKVF